jgi:hypothetical protein
VRRQNVKKMVSNRPGAVQENASATLEPDIGGRDPAVRDVPGEHELVARVAEATRVPYARAGAKARLPLSGVLTLSLDARMNIVSILSMNLVNTAALS